MAETTRNHIFSKEITQVIIAAMVLAAKFLLKKLSASDFSYERKSAFMGQRRWKVFYYNIIWGNRLKGKYIERC